MKNTIKAAMTGCALALATGAYATTPVSENWENSCASCHGQDGTAQTKQGKKLKIRDYTNPKVQAEMKDDEMLKAILEGVTDDKGKERMKGYKDEYSEEEARELVKFIRSLKA
jgi:cytochrome c6